VYLHRLFHDPKIQRDPLVGPATDYLFHDFSLARCQCAETLFDVPADSALMTLGEVELLSLVDRSQEANFVDRLRQKVYCSLLHGLHAGLDVAVTCKENDRTPKFRAIEQTLRIESAHAGHAIFQQQTSGSLAVVFFEEALGRFEGAHLVTCGAQQAC
jgi:hypothetical protein